MGGAVVACKFLGMVFILSLLFQGTCAAQVNNGISTDLNNSINSTINGTIIGNLNGTIGNLNGTLNDTTNETFNGTAVGTINGTFDGSINNTEVFPSILLLPLFLGEGVGCPVKRREKMLGSYREEQLRIYTKRAKYYTEMNERNELVKVLRMNRDLAFKLCMRADIKDLDDLKNSDPKNVHRSICDYKTESQEIHDRSCECSEEVIQNYKEKARIESEINKSPTAAFLAYPVSEKHPLQFKFLDKSTGSPITWKWSFGDGATSNDRNPEHRYCSAKEYTVTLEVESVKGKGTLKEKIDVK